MPELSEKIAAAVKAMEEMRGVEGELEEARARFRQALRDAYNAGVSMTLLARACGLSRQRVSAILNE